MTLKALRLSVISGLIVLNHIACGVDSEADEAANRAADTSRAAVTAGIPTFARPEVGLFKTSNAWCTGTLITERHVLTAAHCIDWEPMRKGGVFIINVFPSGAQQTFPIDRTYSIGFRSNGDQADLAIARLVIPVPPSIAVPATIATDGTPSGAQLTIIGYGLDGRGGPAGVKRTRSWIKTSHDRTQESGDSGGPVFRGPLEANGPIVFTSAATYTGPIYTDRDSYGDPVRLRPYVFDLITAMESEGICYRYLLSTSWSRPYCDGEPTPPTPFLNGLQIISGARSGIIACLTAHRRTGHPLYTPAWLEEACDGEARWWGGSNAKESGRLQNFKIRLDVDPRGRSIHYYAYSTAYSGSDNTPVVKPPLDKDPSLQIRNFAIWLGPPTR